MQKRGLPGLRLWQVNVHTLALALCRCCAWRFCSCLRSALLFPFRACSRSSVRLSSLLLECWCTGGAAWLPRLPAGKGASCNWSTCLPAQHGTT